MVTVHARSLTIALVLACGSAASLAENGAVLRLSTSGGATTLSLDGAAPFHVAAGAVANPRVIALQGSTTILALWNERLADGRTQPMYGIALDGRTFDTVQPAQYEIGLVYGPFDPLRATPRVPMHLAALPDSELFLVQYHVPPLPEMQESVKAAGGVIERYVPQLAQVVRMAPEARARVAALPFVRWVGPYHTAYRMAPELLPQFAAGVPEGAFARYSIETLRAGPAQQHALANLITAIGGQVDVITPDQFRMEATLTPAQLLAVATRNEVNFIDPWLGPGGTDMDIMRQIGGAVPILANAGFLGQGVRGEIFDTGVVPNHQQWAGQAPVTHAATAVDSHGQACYGINFATGTGNAQATGLMPQREQGIFCLYSVTTQFGGGQSRLSLNTEAVNPNLQYKSSFQTSSVGSPRVTTYTTISAETDDYLFKVDYLSCQSQSNAGDQMSRPQAWAKNMLAVGGLDHKNTLTKTDDTVSGASIGPASDGRTKPELAHSYGDIFTTYSTSTTGYGQFGGTSGATPITAGHAGLMMQMWHEGVWQGHGGGSSVFASRPKPATARALLINTAYRYTWTGTPPAGEPLRPTIKREVQGWGMADVGNLYNLRTKAFVINESEVITPLQTKAYNLTVAAGEPNFNVTLVYKDPPGNPSVQSQHRVNNLDLKVTSPTGAVYWGNQGLTSLSGSGHSNVSQPGGAANTKDTVENVFVPGPAPGVWKIEVVGSEIVQDGNLATPGIDAIFALVVTGAQGLPPVKISFPAGVPELLAPGVATPVNVKIEAGSENPVPSSARLHFRSSGAASFTETQLQYLGGTSYRATLPASTCSMVPEFYVSCRGDQNGQAFNPPGAPSSTHMPRVGVVVTIESDNFETNTGWTVQNTFVQSGAWARAQPAGNGLFGDPLTDFDGSGKCWITGPGVQDDVDGGPTILTSKRFNLASQPDARISYARWVYTNDNTGSDNLKVSISNNDGQTWTQVEDIGGMTTAWVVHTFKVSDYVQPTAQVRLRFSIADEPNNSITEAGLDALKITGIQCVSPCYPDCNDDGVLNLADFGCFQTKFALNNQYADCNGDGVLNLADFGCFQTRFAVGCP